MQYLPSAIIFSHTEMATHKMTDWKSIVWHMLKPFSSLSQTLAVRSWEILTKLLEYGLRMKEIPNTGPECEISRVNNFVDSPCQISIWPFFNPVHKIGIDLKRCTPNVTPCKGSVGAARQVIVDFCNWMVCTDLVALLWQVITFDDAMHAIVLVSEHEDGMVTILDNEWENWSSHPQSVMPSFQEYSTTDVDLKYPESAIMRVLTIYNLLKNMYYVPWGTRLADVLFTNHRLESRQAFTLTSKSSEDHRKRRSYEIAI